MRLAAAKNPNTTKSKQILNVIYSYRVKENLETSGAEHYLEIRIIASLQLQGQPRGKYNTGLHIKKPYILPSQVDNN